MKAFGVQRQNGKLVLMDTQLPRPVPKPHEIVVSVRAAGVTPTELLWYPTMHNKDGSLREGAVPGHEFSGVVAALGEKVSRFQVADEIFGMNDWFEDGAAAQLCVSHENSIIRKPLTISHSIAAATPISALTAWQGLVERAAIKSGERVLIVGASGSVGRMAVQIAKLRGCTVFGSASASAEAELKALGCQSVLDYRTQPIEQYLQDIDVVFDAVGGNTLACAEKILAPRARMVTIAADAEGNSDPAIKAAFFIVEPNGSQLEHIVSLMEEGRLQASVKAVLPFAEAQKAYSGTVKPGSGKLVLEGWGDTPEL